MTLLFTFSVVRVYVFLLSLRWEKLTNLLVNFLQYSSCALQYLLISRQIQDLRLMYSLMTFDDLFRSTIYTSPSSFDDDVIMELHNARAYFAPLI